MTDVEPYRPDPMDSWVNVVHPVREWADFIARTEFVPKNMRTPEATAAAILTGRELGLGPMTAMAQIIRGDGRGKADASFTISDAQRAGLTNKKNWREYPRHMLRWRAIAECASMICPDVVLGLDITAQPATPPEPEDTPAVIQVDPAPATPAAAPPEPLSDDVVDADIPDDTELMITPPQLKRLHAMLTDLERITGQRLSRDERRSRIGALIGVDDLGSANDLTQDQASAAISALGVLLADEPSDDEQQQ